jgi:hypothetical protein
MFLEKKGLLFSFFLSLSSSPFSFSSQRLDDFRAKGSSIPANGAYSLESRPEGRACITFSAGWMKAPFTFFFEGSEWVESGNTKGGCITVPLTSSLTGLESAV